MCVIKRFGKHMEEFVETKKRVKIIAVIIGILLVVCICGTALYIGNSYRSEQTADTENVQTDSPAVTETEPDTESDTEPETVPETKAETEPETEIETEPETEPETEEKTEPETEPEPEQEMDDFVEELLQKDISALTAVNSAVFGWILIPDTTVDYPLLQGNDNTYYLNYSWENKWDPAGSIYLDYRSAQDFSDFHTIIYGHRMYDDSMFNSLKYYNNETYLQEHPHVYILNEEGVLQFSVFSAYTAATSGPSWRLGLKETEHQQLLIDYFIQESEIDAGFRPLAENGDRVLTLSTCSQTGDAVSRWVVHAVLSDVFPKK